jgi:hypothetical protein
MPDDPLAEARARLARLFQDLNNAPAHTITGVISHAGAGAANHPGEDAWTCTFTLAAWRDGAGPVNDTPLTVRRRMTKSEWDMLRDKAKPMAVVRLTVKLGTSPGFDGPQALLESDLTPINDDAALEVAIAQLQQPVTYSAAGLATFTLDRSVDWFEGEITWCGEAIRLVLDATGPEELEEAAGVARTLYDNQTAWQRRIRDYAIAELLPLKNEAWLADGEGALAAADFDVRMTLESITVAPDGTFEFWHNDGDLFFGHAIQIGGDLTRGPTHADIPG